jgi:hypothetical protein
VYNNSRLSEQFSGSQAGYGTTFRYTGGYQKAGTSSLKRVTESDFKKASRNFNLETFIKRQLEILKTIRAYSKRTV